MTFDKDIAREKFLKEHPDHFSENNQWGGIKSWKLNHPDRVAAHRKVFIAKRRGVLKQRPCVVCGNLKSESHHEDYSKPLKIKWLCKRHHVEADKIRRSK